MSDISLNYKKAAENQIVSNVPTDVQKTISRFNPFSTDTIAVATSYFDTTTRIASVKESLNSAVSWLCGLIYGQSATLEQPNGRPILEAPRMQDEKARKSFVKEITEMQKRITSLDEEYKELLKGNPQNQEVLLMKLLTLAMKNQLNLKEQGSVSSIKKVEAHKAENQSLNKDQQKIKDELATAEQRALWAGRANTAVGVVAGALALAMLGAAVTAPHIAIFIPGLAGQGLQMATLLMTGAAKAEVACAIAKTGTTLISGYTEGVSETKKKESYLVQSQQELAKDGIKIGYDDLKKALQDISSMWALLRETADRQQEASTSMLR